MPHQHQNYYTWFAFVASALFLPAVGAWKRRGPAGENTTPSTKAKNTLRGSVAPLDRHVIVCTGTDSESWPARLEDDAASLLSRLTKLVSESNRGEQKLRIKITASDAASSTTLEVEGTDCLVYPEAVLVRVCDDNLATFAAALTQKPFIFAPSVPYPHKLLLVCSHMQRDKRCGKSGPMIIAKAKEMAVGVRVMASSHVGGHEFAGTLICYPRADWYGHVTTQRMPEILAALHEGPSCAERCFRGNSFEW